MPARRWLIAIVILAAMVAAGRAAPQNPPPPPQPPPQQQQPPIFREAVDVIRLDVTVLDKDRRPVPGLTIDDFEVYEDGKLQRLVAVSEVDAVSHDPAPSPWMRSVPSDIGTNDLADQIGNGRVFAIVMDDVNVPWDDLEIIMSAREIGRLVVDNLAPSDVAAVIYPRDAGLTQDFTSDRRKLLEAIQKFDPQEPDRWLPGGNTYRGPGQGGGDMIQRFAPSMARSNCQMRQLTVPTLQTIVARLATIPNRRKTVVLVSTGVPLNLGATRDCAGQLAMDMRDTLREAQRGNVNIHSVDPGGYRGYENYLQSPIRRGRPAEYVMSEGQARNATKLRHDFLEVTADETGAHAIVNNQDVGGGITRMIAEDAIYYMVGYQTSNGRPDGKFRRVEVKVRKSGLTVRTRSGYYAPREGTLQTREEERAPSSNDLGLTGMMSPAALPMRAIATAVGLADNGKDAEIAVVLTPRLPAIRAAVHETLTVVRTLYDAESRPGTPVQEKVNVALAPGTGDETRYDVYQRLTLSPGRHSVRLNGTSRALDKSGSVYVDIDVPDFSRLPLSLTRIVLGTPAPADRTDALAPILPIVPTSARDFSASDRVVAFVRVFQGGDGAPVPVTLSTQIFDATDTPKFEERRDLAPEAFGAARAAAVEIPLPLDRLARGPHLLNIKVDGPTGASTRRDLVLRVR
jgi:VWFA-related protein